ncbi:MAG TPA: helix-turn-helix domain-containing protein [Chloroflexia bacterium]|nr:helix-turn-helix domain-containing protein [Chloroflexia bacterium]
MNSPNPHPGDKLEPPPANLKVEERRQSVQQWINEVKELGFNSPAFWSRISYKSEPPVAPEVLVWTFTEFEKAGDPDSARKVIEIIYDRYDRIIQKNVAANCYVKNNSTDKRKELVADITQHTWTELIARLREASLNDKLFIDFERTLIVAIKTYCRNVVRQAGGPVPDKVYKVEKLDASGKPYQTEERKYPARHNQSSWDAPVGQPGFEGEELHFADIVGDAKFDSDLSYDEYLISLKTRLDQNQLEILKMKADELSNAEIARVLGRDRETIARHWAKIVQIAREVLQEFDLSR